METIKVIDLLNKNANGEEMPKEIIFQGCVYEYEDDRNDYTIKNNGYNNNLDSCFLFYGIFGKNRNYLNHTIQIIENILDEKEKEWLGNLIKPFRNQVKSISKEKDMSLSGFEKGKKEYISINCYNPNESFALPDFLTNSMYKNMELDKDYTLEELGL